MPRKFGAKRPPKPPIFPSTSGPCVLFTRAWMRFLTRLPKSTSTPARAYAFVFFAADFTAEFRTNCDRRASMQIRKQRWLRFFGGERFGTAFALFHDVLVQLRVHGERIVAREAGEAELVSRFAGRPHHSFHIEVPEAVDAEVFADLFHRELI